MARPRNKSELLHLWKKNGELLISFIESLPKQVQQADFPEGTLNRNIADVLMHLHHWHLMMMKWYEEGMNGKKPAMPAEGYTWKTVPELNRWIRNRYKDTSLEDAIHAFQTSQEQVGALIRQHTNDELFEKKRYHSTGSTSLGSYLISATSSHYDWALKLLKRVLK